MHTILLWALVAAPADVGEAPCADLKDEKWCKDRAIWNDGTLCDTEGVRRRCLKTCGKCSGSAKRAPDAPPTPSIVVNTSGIWHPSPGFDGTAAAPGRWRRGDSPTHPTRWAGAITKKIADSLYGLGLGCKSFETPNCNIEWDEWNIARSQVTPDDTVIEFGARYGTTSCAIAEATGNSGRVVAVEPDARAHEMMLRNREKNRCNFNAVFGTVSDKPIVLGRLSPFHYNQMTLPASPSQVRSGSAVPNIPYQEVERRIGSKFTAVLLDCEGCIGLVWELGLIQSPSVTLVMMEEDILRGQYTNKWHPQLRELGFTRVWNTWSRTGTIEDHHSAWVRGGRVGVSCFAYRQERGIREHDLRCVDDSAPPSCPDYLPVRWCPPGTAGNRTDPVPPSKSCGKSEVWVWQARNVGACQPKPVRQESRAVKLAERELKRSQRPSSQRSGMGPILS